MTKINTKKEINNKCGNINLDDKLLNKFSSVEEIFKIAQKQDYTKLYGSVYYDLENISSSDLYKLINQIFEKYHPKKYFKNNNNIIYISKKDIKESTNKIFYNPNQDRENNNF